MFTRRLFALPFVVWLALSGCAGPMRSYDDVPSTSDTVDASAETTTPDAFVADVDTGPACVAPQLECLGRCVDAENDANHCGSCDRVCADGEGCYRGECHPACADGLYSCPLPAGDGGVEEVCVDRVNSRLNCGACGHVCAEGTDCSGGVCVRGPRTFVRGARAVCCGGTTGCRGVSLRGAGSGARSAAITS